MEHMRQVAFETILRACGFATLAIFCVMIGLSFDPRMAFQTGGFLSTIMTLILILKSWEAQTKDYRRTEMWLYIAEDRRPPESYAQWASSTILRDTYLTFAMWTSLISITLWTLALFCSVIGTTSTYAYDRASDGSNSKSKSFNASPRPAGEERAVRPPPPIRYQVFPQDSSR